MDGGRWFESSFAGSGRGEEQSTLTGIRINYTYHWREERKGERCKRVKEREGETDRARIRVKNANILISSNSNLVVCKTSSG